MMITMKVGVGRDGVIDAHHGHDQDDGEDHDDHDQDDVDEYEDDDKESRTR